MAVIVSDSFNRANNATTMGVADTGQTWAALEGTWGINNNQAIVSTEDSMAFVESGVSDCVISTTLINQVEGRGIGLRQATGSSVNALQVQIEAHQIAIYQRPAWITVATSPDIVTPVAGSTLKVELAGTQIKVYINNVLLITTTSTYNLTATRHGLGTWKTGAICDDFKIENDSVKTKIGEYRTAGTILPIYSLDSIPGGNQMRTPHPIKGVGCFELVSITDAKASPIRFNAKGTIKAIKKE